jgi:hypothetical protein
MATLDPGITSKRRRGAARKRASRPKKTLDPPKGSPVMTIPAAGRKFFGLSKNGSYDAAERGDFGRVLEIGRRKFVVIAAIEAKLKAAAEAA